MTYLGEPFSPAKAQMATEDEELDAALAAGALDERSYYLEKMGPLEEIGTSVGVVLVPS